MLRSPYSARRSYRGRGLQAWITAYGHQIVNLAANDASWYHGRRHLSARAKHPPGRKPGRQAEPTYLEGRPPEWPGPSAARGFSSSVPSRHTRETSAMWLPQGRKRSPEYSLERSVGRPVDSAAKLSAGPRSADVDVNRTDQSRVCIESS